MHCFEPSPIPYIGRSRLKVGTCPIENAFCICMNSITVQKLSDARELPSGPEFKRLRLESRLSQAELARKIGCSPGRVSRWEAGSVPLPELAKCPLNDVFDELLRKVSQNTARTYTCWICKKMSPSCGFARDNSRTSGLQTKCRNCSCKLATKWRLENYARYIDRRRDYCARIALARPDKTAESSSGSIGKSFRCADELHQLKMMGLENGFYLDKERMNSPRTADVRHPDNIEHKMNSRVFEGFDIQSVREDLLAGRISEAQATRKVHDYFNELTNHQPSNG